LKHIFFLFGDIVKSKTPVPNPFQNAIRSAPYTLESAAYRTVEVLRLYGQLSRTNVADRIGYSPSKMTSVVNTLIEQGVLEEVGEGLSSGGRRARVMDFNPNYGHIVVASVESSQMDVALVDFRGNVRVRRMMPMAPDQTPQAVLSIISSFIHERLDKLNIPVAKICGFGLTTPLSINLGTGILLDSPELPAWGGYQIDSHMRELFPYSVVVVEKDANAMALGELRRGAASENASLLYLKFGERISGGLILHGQIYRGASGRAGDILNTPTGDTDALAETLANLIAFIDPDVVILGADVYAAEPDLAAAISRQVMRLPNAGIASRRVKRPALGAEAAMVGMIARVAESVFALNAR